MDSPIAVAMNAVLHTKYAVAAPTSGLGTIHNDSSAPGGKPPNAPYTSPAAFTVNTSDAMLYSVRYGGLRVFIRKVHWLHALAAATSIVASAPSSSSDAKSTAYETDIEEPLLVSGRLTFSAEASEENSSSATNSAGSLSVRGANAISTMAPAATTAPT